MTAGLELLIGREVELDAIERFFDRLPARASALMLEGEAGIGKTTLWLGAQRSAEARCYRVLQARPAESEARLSYAVLTDLVGAAFDEARASLPLPQERALATTLLRDSTAGPADARTIATALVSLLSVLARDLACAPRHRRCAMDRSSVRDCAWVCLAPIPTRDRTARDATSRYRRGAVARPRAWPFGRSFGASRPAATVAGRSPSHHRQSARHFVDPLDARACRRGLARKSVLRSRDRTRAAEWS
jgi:AAA ATPase domain